MTIARTSLVFAWIALAGCRTANRRDIASPLESEQVKSSGVTQLGVGDVFEVRIFQEPDLSGMYRIGSDGTIEFPLCRRVALAGMDANAAAEKIRLCLAQGYLRQPQVSVLVKEYNSKKIFIFGEVQKPGTFAYEDSMSAIHAITLAGGFTKTAAQNSTSVTRLVGNQEVKIKIPVQDIALGKSPNFAVQPGDIIYVPESVF